VLSCPVVYRLFYRTATLGPIFECTHVVHLGVAHIFEHLTSQSRATARRAIRDELWDPEKMRVHVDRHHPIGRMFADRYCRTDDRVIFPAAEGVRSA
jgi:hypothetical protein